MLTPSKELTIATRGSKLALWQAQHIRDCLIAAEPELVVHLRSALQELASGDRRLVALRMLDGVPFKDIGARLGKSEEAVKKAHARAIDRLRAVLVSNIMRAGRQGGCS